MIDLGHELTRRLDTALKLAERWVAAREKEAEAAEKMAETDEARRTSGR